MLATTCALLAAAAQSCADDPMMDAAAPEAGAEDGDRNDAPVDSSADDGVAADASDAGALDAGALDADVSDAVYLEAGARCEDAGLDCAPGLLCCVPCCLAGGPPTCVAPGFGGRCPLPDLSVDQAALGAAITIETVDAGPCELEEACLADAGQRRVLRFDVRIPNRGAADLVLGNPEAGAAFMYAPCHGHFHFIGFARYTLLDDAGTAVVVGRKQAFCARDSRRIDPTASFFPKYDCAQQGIQRGWEDIYDPTLPCQYLDITDVPPGTYRLEVEVNPERTLTELGYDDNVASVPVVLP